MRHMHDMELHDSEKLDYPTPLPMNKPDYPCGLILTLTEREFEKLPGIDPADAEVGGLVHLFAMAKVISVNHHQNDQGKDCWCVGLQITTLGLEDESAETEPDADAA